MCDSFYLPASRGSFFGKNSDRRAAEPQALRLVPGREPSSTVAFGGRSFELPDAGHALALSCPCWMPGAEMGLNGAGVAIGNEAVFSRFKAAPDGVLGMDFVRAALSSSSSAREALDALISLTERYSQGGNGAYKGRLVYNNSYLVVGPDGAYVLETAARRWAWKEVSGPTALSNSYSITDDYKRLDAETRKAIAPVNKRMACLDEADAGRIGEKGSWKAYVEDRFMSRFSAGDARRRALGSLLTAVAGTGDRKAAMAALRAHAAIDPDRPSRTRKVCDHDRDIMGNPTTGSMLVEYRADATVLWFTGASYACANLFKPVLLSGGEFVPLWTEYDYREGSDGGEAYWKARRAATRSLWRRPRAGHDAALAEAQSALSAAVDDPRRARDGAPAVNDIVRAWDSRPL